jgi:hypothetical protein
LPKLIGLRALEAALGVLALLHDRLLLDEIGVVQNAADLRLRHAERLEARQHVADPARAEFRVLLTELHDRLRLRALLLADNTGALCPWRVA